MSSPINQPSALLAAQVVSYNEGQKFQGSQSSERKEKERLFNMQMEQARKQNFMQKTPETGKGVLA